MSIFGHTIHGVPSPQVPHVHPYPTRYHGPLYTVPRFGLPFRRNTYAVAPYAGLGSCGTGCGRSAGGEVSDLEALGSFAAPVTEYGRLADAVVGGLLGYIAAPNDAQRLLWAGGGAVAGAGLGCLGIGGLIGAAAYHHLVAKK